MATGMGGTNAHVVLEEAPVAAQTADARPPHLLIVSAKTQTALDQATHLLRDFLSGNEAREHERRGLHVAGRAQGVRAQALPGLHRSRGRHRRAGAGRLESESFPDEPTNRAAR